MPKTFPVEFAVGLSPCLGRPPDGRAPGLTLWARTLIDPNQEIRELRSRRVGVLRGMPRLARRWSESYAGLR